MSITDLFNFLGSPLANNRWSWGAINHKTNDLVLRVWTDERVTLDDMPAYFIWGKREGQYSTQEDTRQGAKERTKQVEQIDSFNRIVLVVCTKDGKGGIKTFNKKRVFMANEVENYENGIYAKVIKSMDVHEYAKLTHK